MTDWLTLEVNVKLAWRYELETWGLSAFDKLVPDRHTLWHLNLLSEPKIISFHNFTDHVIRTFYVSVLTIFCFSWERYLAICHPIYLYTMAGTARTTRWVSDGENQSRLRDGKNQPQLRHGGLTIQISANFTKSQKVQVQMYSVSVVHIYGFEVKLCWILDICFALHCGWSFIDEVDHQHIIR